MTVVLKSIDDKIQQAFSRAASRYEELTSLHKDIGQELLRKASKNECVGSILDIGMGTGWLTAKLKICFPETQIVGLDFADGMIEVAEAKKNNIQIVKADAECLPFQKNSFDMVFSNLAYQWINDLPQAFTECRRVLKEDGKLCLSMFGYQTFRELFEALAITRGDNKVLEISRLAKKEEIETAINKAGFRKVQVKEETIHIGFSDMMALLKWVKDIGANALIKDMFVGRDWLVRADAYYRKTFQDRLGVYATFEVIWVEAEEINFKSVALT